MVDIVTGAEVVMTTSSPILIVTDISLPSWRAREQRRGSARVGEMLSKLRKKKRIENRKDSLGRSGNFFKCPRIALKNS